MKKLIITLILSMFLGCSVDVFEGNIDRTPPEAPRNVFSITGDNEVIVAWNENRERDLDYYVVYKSSDTDGPFKFIGETYDTYFIADIPNGLTYYFAVSAVDFDGNESDLSMDDVWDTPRPEGYETYVWALIEYDIDDYENYGRCGIDFSDFKSDMTQSFDNSSNDVFFDIADGQVFMNVYNLDDTDISIYGPTEFLSDVDFVYEDTDWIESGYLPVYEDYSYVIWTWDNHFVTIRIEEVYDDLVVFSWAYQTDPGNPQLKMSVLNNKGAGNRKANPPSKSKNVQYLKVTGGDLK